MAEAQEKPSFRGREFGIVVAVIIMLVLLFFAVNYATNGRLVEWAFMIIRSATYFLPLGSLGCALQGGC